MDKMKKTKIQLLMKIIALTIVCVMVSQLFPSIVFGIQQSNELHKDVNIITEEKVEDESPKEEKKETEQEEAKNEATNEEIQQEETKEEKVDVEKEETKQEETEEKTEQSKLGQEVNNRTGLQVQDTKEIVEKRKLNEKHFLQKDGSIVASVYPMNVHYELNGKLEDINNSLEEKWRRT